MTPPQRVDKIDTLERNVCISFSIVKVGTSRVFRNFGVNAKITEKFLSSGGQSSPCGLKSATPFASCSP